MEHFTTINTDRLCIRSLELTDKEAMFAYRNQPEVLKFQSWPVTPLEQIEQFIRNNMAVPPNTAGTWLQLGITLKNGELIGDIGLHFMEDGAQMEIGYTLSPEYQGQGYATEAVTAIFNYLFLTLNKYRITASVDPDNARSIKLLEKLGFRKEAHFKKSLMIRGEWVDDVVYALLQEEWKAQR